MKLLLADDEILTREGILESLDWAALGITEILQAKDGLHGVELALEHHPSIILSDVRMPRLGGIEMVQRLERELPDAQVVFMSGHSDKDYLKAAIKLKAVSYIEKPINRKELQDAILEAKQRHQDNASSRLSAALYAQSLRTQVASLWTRPFEESQAQLGLLCTQGGIALPGSPCFVAFVLRTQRKSLPNGLLNQCVAQLDTGNVHLFHTPHTKGLVAFFVVTKHPLRGSTQQAMAEKLYHLFAPHCQLTMGYATGEKGDQRGGYAAYSTAKTLAERGFFLPHLPILSQEVLERQEQIPDHGDISQVVPQFVALLSERKEQEAQGCLDNLRANYLGNLRQSRATAVEVYYRYILAIHEAMLRSQLDVTDLFPREDLPISEQLECELTITDVQRILTEKTQGFFQLLNQRVSQSATIFLIKDFISKHYGDENLSAKEIADFIDFSLPYLCTYFKAQTGQTPNQYLTEYRMEKAKQLLADGRNRVSEISSMVGYRDGNYFGKSFRKYTGLSPSQYREQVMV
ncbi:MAG: response regulator [Eubacteriales bacterium]